MTANDTFELYDLRIEVESIEGNCTCNMSVGDCFYLAGGKLSLPDGADFCLYALQATIPLLPAKQRLNHPADWMETDSRVICPDPACRLTMRIDRISRRTLRPRRRQPDPLGRRGISWASDESGRLWRDPAWTC
ncbi:MAG: TIGR04076 family protein [Caldilineaceae bacterium]|nr:TIGR04076 family protein [Caldilineaceae bacterium]